MKKSISVFILTLASFLLSISSVLAAEEGLEVGNKAPDFETVTLDGETVKLSDFEGEKVLLNFWATWCPPCREEMPDMQQFYESGGATVLAVNVTDTEINENNVSMFMEEFGFTFPVLMDKKAEIANLYRISPIPVSYLLDPEGVIQHKVVGPMNYDMMIEEFEKIK